MATIINGKEIAAEIQQEISSRVTALIEKHGITPCISVILVGDRKDSATYVRMKEQTAKQLSISFQLHKFNEGVTEEELIEKIQAINNDPKVHGLIVQLPLPNHLNEHNITYQISQEKDIDGMHPHNIGKLALKGYTPKFVSCTPKGCMELLKRSNIPISGKDVVVVGRSNIVGIPISLLLLESDATVTICHSKTNNLAEKVGKADIVIAAVGRANFIKGDWIKEGAVVIDVGINAVEDASRPSGYRLVGDVDFDTAKDKASFITPVPGGVGPMTFDLYFILFIILF